jgi:hypothetical protein
VINRGRFAFSDRLLNQQIDHAAVFGVHAYQAAVLSRLPHGTENGGIVYHQYVRVGHEELEAGHTFAHHLVHVFKVGFGEIRDDHVQAVVDGSLLPFLPPGIECRAYPGSLGLSCEIDQAGCASERRRPCAGSEIIARKRAAEGHVHVGVDIDAAGDDIFPRGVNHRSRVGLQCGADGRDLLSFNIDIRDVILFRGDDASVPNECGHPYPRINGCEFRVLPGIDAAPPR